MPLLEETGYMPRRKYSDGNEIRAYCNIIGDKYALRDRALFQSAGKVLTWQKDHWICGITIAEKGGTRKCPE